MQDSGLRLVGFPSRSPDRCRSAGVYCDLTIAMRGRGSDVAVRYGGHPNKSVGDAFLLVWRHLPVDMGNAFLARDDATKELLPKDRCSGGTHPRARWARAHQPGSSHVIIHRVLLWCMSCSPFFHPSFLCTVYPVISLIVGIFFNKMMPFQKLQHI